MSKCEDCKQREGILDYSESLLNYSHGFVAKICRQCYIKKLEKVIETNKKQIKIQKALIRKDKFRSKTNENQSNI